MKLEEIRVNPAYATSLISDYQEGEKGDSKPIINKRIIRTDSLMRKLSNVPKFARKTYEFDTLFPPNCRYYETHPEGSIVVIEEPPAYRTITCNRDFFSEVESLRASGKLAEYGYENWLDENSKPYTFNLALPYCVFFLAFNNVFDLCGGKIFFRTQPLSGFSDVLCKAPFFNISNSQNVCFGDNAYKGPKRNIFADTNYVISSFWSSHFNQDYIYNYLDYQQVAGLCDYLTWEYYSHTDPMFIYTADWIKYHKNVFDVLKRVREWIIPDEEEDDHHRFGYRTLENLFIEHLEDGQVEVPGIGIRETLIYDICQYIYLDHTVTFRVGDSFKDNKGHMLYLDAFLGFRSSPEPLFISVVKENGKCFKMKLNNKVRAYILEKLKEERYVTQYKLPNGEILKSGDILIQKNSWGNDVYTKIYYLRKTANGDIEGRFGSEYYIVKNLPDTVKTMDTENPIYCDIPLKKGEEYFIVRNEREEPKPLIHISDAEFVELTTDMRQRLILKLVESTGDNKGYEYKVKIQESSIKRIYTKDELEELPKVFRVGSKLSYGRLSRRSSSSVPGPVYRLKGKALYLPYNTTLQDASSMHYSDDEIIKDDKFVLKSWDYDIEFSVGDKVVTSNWENPVDMLTVKQITGFEIDSISGAINFNMVDKNGKEYKHEYVTGRNKIVRIGTVRKITNVYNELSAGMKITANKAGISMFPKKDTNIIIGFLTDTGGSEPLVLCSNACTLWYTDIISNFDIIPMSDEAWKTKAHAPITPSKMRIQAGDVLEYKDHYSSHPGFVAYRPPSSRGIRAKNLSYYLSYNESYVFDKSFTESVVFRGFPNPRMTAKQENKVGFVSGYENYHGMITMFPEHLSTYMYHNDPRSILNVPDSSE
jgi:hypothetical protein